MVNTQTDQTEPVNGPFIGVQSRSEEIQQRNGIVFSIDSWEGCFFPDTLEFWLHHIDTDIAGVYCFEIYKWHLYVTHCNGLFVASDGSTLDSARASGFEDLFITKVAQFYNSNQLTIVRAIGAKNSR